MAHQLDRKYLLQTMENLIRIPSPVGYYEEITPLLHEMAGSLGYKLEFDRKRTAYIKVKGESSHKTVCVGAHLDTLGLVVRSINSDGTMLVRNIGGINYNNIEGETATVHTRDGRSYTGMIVCKYHSVHVFDEAKTINRNENTMLFVLDQDISSKEQVRTLGIQNGDVISLETHFNITETGFIKSRYIDNKACAACVFSVLKYMKENNLKPACDTWFAFPFYEEIGHGGAYVPEEISEYIALDIGVIGPEHAGSEETVSICSKDAFSPYDRELTTKVIDIAKEAEVDYVVDVFYHYSTDGGGAIKAGNNVQAAAFGPGTFSSHGMERTTIHAVEETQRLLLEVLLNNK